MNLLIIFAFALSCSTCCAKLAISLICRLLPFRRDWPSVKKFYTRCKDSLQSFTRSNHHQSSGQRNNMLVVSLIRNKTIQYRSAKMITCEQLSLYFGIGCYVSEHSRINKWGTGAIEAISEQIKKELPGLHGFSAESIKKMRQFYEFWNQFINRSPTATDLQVNDSKDVTLYVQVNSFVLLNFTQDGVRITCLGYRS